MRPNDTAVDGRACRICGDPITGQQSEARGFHCSMACYRISRRSRVACACQVCGTVILEKPSTIARGGGKFCGLACRSAAILAVPIADRIWPKVKKDGLVPEHRSEYGPCWDWTGATNSAGYAHIGRDGKTPLVSHIVWGLATGQEPQQGEFIGHVCDRPLCVRNDDEGTYTVRGIAYPRRGHLFLCNHAANTEDAREKGRRIVKIDDAQAVEIRARRADGALQADLAREYGVSQVTISLLVRGLSHRQSL